MCLRSQGWEGSGRWQGISSLHSLIVQLQVNSKTKQEEWLLRYDIRGLPLAPTHVCIHMNMHS